MNVQLPVKMDQQRFLAWVQGREERYELDRGRVIAMAVGSRAHWQITLNLARTLVERLDPERFAVLPEFGVDLGPDSIRFPDVVVDAAGEASGDLKATAPVLIAEVLSPFVRADRPRRQGGGVSSPAKPAGLSRVRAGRDEGLGVDARSNEFSGQRRRARR